MKLSIVQAFIVTKTFLGKVFFDGGYSDELNILHAGFRINTWKKDWLEEPETFDPSVWIDWERSIQEVLGENTIDTTKILVNEYQAYLIMKKYVRNFGYEFNFKDIIQLFEKLDIDKEQNFKVTSVWKDWMLSVNAFLEDRLTDTDSLVSLHDFIVSDDQAYYMMELFLENYCLKSEDREIMAILQEVRNNKKDINGSFCKSWVTIYNECCIENSESNISVVQAYNVMRIFLEQVLCNESNQDCLKKFRVSKKNHIPRDYMIWYDWLHVAYKVLLP